MADTMVKTDSYFNGWSGISTVRSSLERRKTGKGEVALGRESVAFWEESLRDAEAEMERLVELAGAMEAHLEVVDPQFLVALRVGHPSTTP